MDGEVAPIGELLVSARSGLEYAAMFALSIDTLGGRRVLDCPGGASAFTADAAAAGADATAADPVYARDHTELVAHAHAETRRGSAYVRDHLDRYVWTYFADPAAHLAERSAAIDRFAADRDAHPERYVAAELPQLPFADDAFGLALSSHLLFTYDDRLDEAFHRAAVVELLRVASEVRLFPTLSMRFERSPLVDAVVDAARAVGAEVATVRSPYEFQRGGDELLVAHRS